MIYVFRRSPSESAKALAAALGGRRVRTLSRLVRLLDREPGKVVCWGEHFPGGLNGDAPLRSKFTDAVLLKDAKVPTIEAVLPYPPLPYPLEGEWLCRWFNHVGGNDLLSAERAKKHDGHIIVEYQVKKENLLKEYRVHYMNGRSIRAGVKVPREGVPAHPWIRSFDGGWKVKYDGFHSTPVMRRRALKAIQALGLQFCAVDIGEEKDGKLIVLEVNRAPGLEGGTIKAYANAIKEWAHDD